MLCAELVRNVNKYSVWVHRRQRSLSLDKIHRATGGDPCKPGKTDPFWDVWSKRRREPICRLSSGGCRPYGTIMAFFPSAIVHFYVRKQAALAAVRKIAVFLSPNPPEEPFLFVASACTVDLDMPNCVAAERTVARFSMMYTARSQARSSIFVYKYTTPHSLVFNVYEREAGDMFRPRGRRQR